MLSFNTTGEVQLSDNRSDRARAAGTSRTAPGSPLPTVNAGALIGRVGNSRPFGIGDQASVPMPFDGILFLAVNDDERSDNAGEFVVAIGRGPPLASSLALERSSDLEADLRLILGAGNLDGQSGAGAILPEQRIERFQQPALVARLRLRHRRVQQHDA